MRSIVLFKEDLRITDNFALYHATHNSADGVIGLYLIDEAMWHDHQVAAVRVQFIMRGLKELSSQLLKLNIPLLILSVKATKQIPQEVLKIAQKYHVNSVFFNNQYEVNESRRDDSIEELLKKYDITCQRFHDQTVLLPNKVLTQQGEPFKVFTSYKNAWYLQFMSQGGISLLPRPKKMAKLICQPSKVPELKNFESVVDASLWPAGERAARKRLDNFILTGLMDYEKNRDFPAIAGTSQLSAYLASGMISPRECFLAALLENSNEISSKNKGAVTWMVELIWRDFYKQILINNQRVSMHKPYKLQTEKLHWRSNQNHNQAWQQGQTGFPLVDAAMRQLNTIGWMHNRLRMVVAMFYSKNLFLDWRMGEAYFMQHLIDGDLASNNGGWQWSASTGTDAVPYFRIFNPITQSERFDPEGKFIREYCPELSDLSNRAIHDPYTRAKKQMESSSYPQPIVNLKKTREQAIAAFKALGTGM